MANQRQCIIVGGAVRIGKSGGYGDRDGGEADDDAAERK